MSEPENFAPGGARNGDSFYRDLNEHMLDGLRDIFRTMADVPELAGAGQSESNKSAERTRILFAEASDQLDEVIATTFKAADNIMREAEALLDRNQEAVSMFEAWHNGGQAGPDDGKAAPFPLENLRGISQANVESLTSIITELSFQDLTGQRLKKVMSTLNKIRSMVLDMYLSTGLILKIREESPEKNMDELKLASKAQLGEIRGSELKGPSVGTNQADVDSLLAELGL